MTHHSSRSKEIINSKTGQKLKFLVTGNESQGKLLEMEASYAPGSDEPAPHYHPRQEEQFTVLSGNLTVRIDNEKITLQAGEILVIPQGKVHSMWNEGAQEAIVNWKVYPAMETEDFLRTFTGLANDGRTNEKGMPNILQVAQTAGKYAHLVRLASPSYPVQKVLFTVLKPFACLSGYRPTYAKYLEEK